MIYTLGHSNWDWDVFRTALGDRLLLDVRSHTTSRHPQYNDDTMRLALGYGYVWMPGLGGWSGQHAGLELQYPLAAVTDYTLGHFPKQRIAKSWPDAGKDPGCPLHGLELRTDALLVWRDKSPACTCQEYAKQHPDAVQRPVWRSAGLYDYAWFMTTPEFLRAADDLMDTAVGGDVALVCCEAVPWRCHRSMISDYLLYRGVNSMHLIPRATKTKGVVVDGRLHTAMIGNRLERYPAVVRAAWDVWVRN